MGANDAVAFCGKCKRQWPYSTTTCKYCGSKLVTWNDSYESEQQAIKKWQERNR